MGISFVGLVNEFGGAGAPFVGGVAVYGHESEQVVQEVVCRFW